MSDKIAEIQMAFTQDDGSAFISNMWDTYNNQRASKMADWSELKKYLFATDTSSTTNSTLPWKNSTTLPKLTQIRDNLHSNYLSALFPNDKWLQWTAYTKDAAQKEKAKNITSYMENKARQSKLRTTVSRLLYDYIDYGNAFCTVDFEKRYNSNNPIEIVPEYIGPRLRRISPEDIVFNPLATTIKDTPKIIRSIKTMGELKKLAMVEPEQMFWEKAIARREEMKNRTGGWSKEDFHKAIQIQVDGFGSMYEYLQGNYMEILEFFGDYHNPDTGVLELNRIITVVDRSFVVRNEPCPTYSGAAPIWHVGWRFRPDNLWAMGPLDNLVGMQYRIDHLENLKADAMDLIVHPPLKIMGEVEEFVWGPGVEIHIDENGDVQEVSKNLNAIVMANNDIGDLEDRMELYAGAPREAMGVRSPGEKTALEVQTLNNAAGRIFQEKATSFEIELLEPALNGMLESARRNMDSSDIISSLDTDLGVQQFTTITKTDITAAGVIRPVGARHFAQQAQELQNLIGIANSPIWAKLEPHTSGIGLTKFVEDVTAISAYQIFRPNIAVEEAQETQALVGQAQEDVQVQQSMPTPTNTLPPEAAPQGM